MMVAALTLLLGTTASVGAAELVRRTLYRMLSGTADPQATRQRRATNASR